MTEIPTGSLTTSDETVARFRAVVETIVDGIITIDERGIIDFANPAAGRMFGYPPSDLIGRNVILLMPASEASRHDGYLADNVRTGVAKILGVGREVVGQRADGTTFPVDLAVSELQVAGRRLFTGVVRDVTERHETERLLQRAQQAAEAASRAKSAFLRNMSHELRTPLTPILGYTDLLLDEELSDDQHEMIASIQSNGHLLLKQISQLLEMAAIDEGNLSVENEPCELVVLACYLQSELTDVIASRGLMLELETSPTLPPVCWTDPPRVLQILKLLIETALNSSSGGEFHLVVRPSDNQSAIIFDIVATGCSLSDEQLAAQFDTAALYGSGQLLTEGLGGFGLPLAQRLAEGIGGRLTVDTTGGAGSRFSLHMPLASMPARDLIEPVADPTPQVEPTQPAVIWQGKHILLAEDVRENQRLIQHLLAKHGLQPTIVATGYAAVTEALLAETAGRPFDLILMDIQMPGLNGWDATRRLRTAGLTAPIIALTALASPHDQQECLDAGCQEVVTKPVTFARFTELLRRWLTVDTQHPLLTH